jgi:hypothetical protein
LENVYVFYGHWNIEWTFVIFYDYLVFLCSFGTFIPVLVSRAKKNLATLAHSSPASKGFSGYDVFTHKDNQRFHGGHTTRLCSWVGKTVRRPRRGIAFTHSHVRGLRQTVWFWIWFKCVLHFCKSGCGFLSKQTGIMKLISFGRYPER